MNVSLLNPTVIWFTKELPLLVYIGHPKLPQEIPALFPPDFPKSHLSYAVILAFFVRAWQGFRGIGRCGAN